MRRGRGGSASVRASLLPQLAGDLAAHLATEEDAFYPAACAALDEHAAVKACLSRHEVARRALERALDSAVDGEEFAVAIRELHGVLALHAEEQESLFPRLERALDAVAMRRLGRSMMAHYDAKQETGFEVEDRQGPRPTRARPAVRP